ncbi:MAG: hypothetical protein ACRED0_05980 [Gammaproteobacteria bacterium]
MKAHRNWSAFALSSTVLALSSQVHANPEVGMGFSQSTADGKVVGIDTVLNTVIVKCPTAGHLVATASARFRTSWGAGSGDPPQYFSYYVKKDKVFASAHRYEFDFAGLPPDYDYLNFPPIQRVDTCKAAQTVRYDFQAKEQLSGTLYADKPRLVVVFIKDNKIQ